MRLDHADLQALVVAVQDETLLAQVQQGLNRLAGGGERPILVTKPDGSLPHLCTRFRPCVLIVEGELILSAPWAQQMRTVGVAGTTMLAIVSDRHEATALRLLHHGCAGILESRSVAQTLMKAVSCLLRGEYWVNRRLLSIYCRSLRSELQFGVSRREREIWELIASGVSNSVIAEKLCVSPQTVRWHIRGLYSKIGAANRQQAVQLWFSCDAKMVMAGAAARIESSAAEPADPIGAAPVDAAFPPVPG